MITVQPDPAGRAGTAQLRVAGAAAASGTPRLRIRREGWDHGTLGPKGWQGEDALLAPDEVAADGADLLLTVGWAVCEHLEAGTYTVGLPDAGIAEPASWPNIRPVRAAARPRPAPLPVAAPAVVQALPPVPVMAVAPPPLPLPAPILAPPPLPPTPPRRGRNGTLVAALVLLALLIAGAGGYWFGTAPGRTTVASAVPPPPVPPPVVPPVVPAVVPPAVPTPRPASPAVQPPPAPVPAPPQPASVPPVSQPNPPATPPASYAESLLCGRFVQYRNMGESDFLGVWSGTWNNGRLCGGLVVQGRSDTSAEVSYVYSLTGPSQTPHFIHGMAAVDGDSLRFGDDQGGHFTFSLTGDGQTLAGHFTDPRNHELTTIFRRK